MKIVRKLIGFIVILYMFSCVSMKKFSSVNTLLTEMKKDSTQTARIMNSQNDRIDDLLRRNISLGRDTLRLFNDYFNLLERFERTKEDNRLEIARLNTQLRGSSKRSNNSQINGRVSKVASSLSKSTASLGDEIAYFLRQQNKSLFSIDNKNWELVIRLRDSLLYMPVTYNTHVEYDRSRLTREGEALLAKIASMLVEKDNFDITTREYIYVNSPRLQNIPHARIEDLSTPNKKVLEAVIDTLVNKGVMVINTTNSSLRTNEMIAQRSGVIDIEQSYRRDSINAVREAERIRREELERVAEYNKQKERAYLHSIDRSTVIVRTLMKYSYHNMGSSKITREVSYIKLKHGEREGDWIEIVLRPSIGELYETIKDIENRNR